MWDRWNKAKARGASDKTGWSLQGALSLLVDTGDIVGYAKLTAPGTLSLEKLAQVLASGRLVYTGSARGNWRKIGETHVYEESSTFAGHAYCLVGYDLERRVAIARNSWSETWGDRGHFYIPEAQLSKLYSTYVVLDPSDVDKMRDVRNARAKKYADLSREVRNGQAVWNGERPDDIATDDEIRLMVSRGLNIMGARYRKWWADTFDAQILRGKGLVNIWNGKEATKYAQPTEIAAMFTRAVKRNPSATPGMLTRFQVAAVVGRDFLSNV